MEQTSSGRKCRNYDASFKEEILKMVLNTRIVGSHKARVLVRILSSNGKAATITILASTPTTGIISQVQSVGLAEQQAL